MSEIAEILSLRQDWLKQQHEIGDALADAEQGCQFYAFTVDDVKLRAANLSSHERSTLDQNSSGAYLIRQAFRELVTEARSGLRL